VILLSRADDLIPFADSEELARSSGATLIEVVTNHRLAAMLRACEAHASCLAMERQVDCS